MKNMLYLSMRIGTRLKQEWQDFCRDNGIGKDFFYLVSVERFATIIITLVITGPIMVFGVLMQEITD